MEGSRHNIQKAVEEIGKVVGEKDAEELRELASKVMGQGVTPKDALGVNEQMIEGIYGQAYRLYNTGKYPDASKLFRLLIMLNAAEPKYAMGLAACFHMMKEYAAAAEMYTACGMVDPKNPIPHYHASDCYIQLGDKMSATIALELAVRRSGERPEYQQLKDRALLTIQSLKEEITKPKEF